MLRSKELAGLIGPVLIVLTLSEIKNAHILSENTVINIYQNGMFLFIAGVAIVRYYTVWEFTWPVIITLVGWFFVLLGLFRMFFPAYQVVVVNSDDGFLFLLPVLLLLGVGIYLTVKGYHRRHRA